MRKTGEPEPVRGGKSVRETVKKEAVRQVKKQVRRAAMEATRSRLGLDREESDGKKKMYGAWMGRVKENRESREQSGEEEKPPRPVSPLYLCLGASYSLLAALRFQEGVRKRRRTPYYCGLTYLTAAGVYFLLDCLNRTEE